MNLRGEAYLLELKEDGYWKPFMFMVGNATQLRDRRSEIRSMLRFMREDCEAPCVGRVRQYPVAGE